MRNRFLLGLWMCLVAGVCLAQPPEKKFGWVWASDQTAQLDPADYHGGRVYHPAPEGGNMHVIIKAERPVTVMMAPESEWNDALNHPDEMPNINFRCVKEHVVEAIYECHLPSERPMVLVVHDERTGGRALVQGISVVLNRGVAHQFVSPNSVRISYHRWACVENCREPQFQWTRLVKEKYETSPVPKLYSVLNPERDGQPVWVKIKAPMPMTVAVLPSQLADEIYNDRGALASALSQTTCKQRGVEKMEFNCQINAADGPHSLIVIPEGPLRNHKKTEIELQTSLCVANCDLMQRNEQPQ
jgi:hypothetical protein